MAEAIELKRPGIEILQVFEAVSPTVITPTLMPCIMGTCKQIVEVLEASATGGTQLNASAKSESEAWVEVIGTSFTLLADLGLSINNSPTITVDFSAASLSATKVVDEINQELQDNVLYDEAYAELTYDSDGAIAGWRMRTRATGDQQSIKVTAPIAADLATLTAFAIGVDHVYRGMSTYAQSGFVSPFFTYPDPRDNIAELALDTSTPRFFLYLGSGTNLQEALTTQALLCRGEKAGGGHDCTNIQPQDDADGDATTPLIRFTGLDFSTAGAAIEVTGTAATSGWAFGDINGLDITLDDGSGEQTYTFAGVTTGNEETEVLAQLEAAFGSGVGGKLSFSVAATFLVITTDEKGSDAYLKISGTAGLLTELGLTAATHYADHANVGATPAIVPFAPLAGDDLYISGVYRGRVVEVAPGGVVTDLKLDTEVLTTIPTAESWDDFYIVARNLPNTGGVRPAPDLDVGSDGALTVKHSLVRDTTGAASSGVIPSMYMYYEALRLDVSTAAADPELLTFDSSGDVEDLLEPVSVDNPLALGLYFALLNSGRSQVSGIGISATSADQPYGTTDAYDEAFDFLESKEVYSLAPMTHDLTVAALGLTHVTTMSEPEYKGERIILFAVEFPVRAPDTAVTSGVNGNADGTSHTFSTGVANLAQLVLAMGITPTGTIDPDEGLYLDIAADSENYSIKSISGDTVTLRYQTSDFAAGENDDSFYVEADIPQVISGTFAIKKRGALLVDTNNNADKNAIADAYQDIAVGFNNRRFWHHALDTLVAQIDSIDQVIPGFYWCAMKAGAIAGQPPQQSFTNFPITGANAVRGTNKYFSDRQLNRMAAGGNCMPIQETANGPIFERMSLTTDVSSIETRTDSITKVIDFTSKFIRRMLRTYIGRFNINQNYLDTLSHVLSGAKAFLTGTFVLVDMDINEIVQDAEEPDSVSVDATLDPPYPCNYIRVRLVI